MIQTRPYEFMVKYTPQREWIEGMGILIAFAFFLGAVLGPLAGGWLYDNLGRAMPFYLNTAGLLVGALLVAAVLREPRRQPLRSRTGT